jgi:AmpD protein
VADLASAPDYRFHPHRNRASIGYNGMQVRNDCANYGSKSRLDVFREGELKLDAQCDWLEGVERVLSPNCDERPEGTRISLVIVHGISLPPGEFGGPWIDQLFTNQLDRGLHPYFEEIADLRVSTHLLVRRDGKVVQYVPFSKRAWHAGPSCFRDKAACNDFSIGIELEGEDETPYTEEQYQVLAKLIAVLREAYPAIGHDAVVGHCDVAPGRKTDPGLAFDWQHLNQLLIQQA